MSNFEIIYIDDDIEDLDIFAEALNDLCESEQRKIGLMVFNSGNEVVPLLLQGNNSRRVIFLDINMPGKNGFQVLTEIREYESLQKVPVMMYSTSDDQRSVKISYDLGANSYIIKPDNISALKEIIRTVLSINWENSPGNPANFILNPAKKN